MKKIAIIPARSGSKGLKDKNIIDLCGKPLLAYSIEAALKSHLFDQVIVSTDSKDYGDIARQYEADVLYREEELSNDQATTYMVLKDLLRRIKQPYDYFALLQPTSPMRTAAHIIEAAEMFEDRMKEFDFLVSVTKAEHAKILVNKIENDRSLKYFDTDFSVYRRQETADYSPNGAIFLAKPKEYLCQKHFFGARSLAYFMSKEDSLDIDDWMDYELARICIRAKREQEKNII